MKAAHKPLTTNRALLDVGDGLRHVALLRSDIPRVELDPEASRVSETVLGQIDIVELRWHRRTALPLLPLKGIDHCQAPAEWNRLRRLHRNNSQIVL